MPTPLLQHPEVLAALPDTVGVRTRFFHVRQRLYVFGTYPRSKSTRGKNRGWMRIPLGGTGGNQYQLWWRPVRGADGSRRVVLGTIRHHDDHAYLPVPAPDDLAPVSLDLGRSAPAAEDPWTSSQRSFLALDSRVRLLKGLPGSGKTTALWEMAARSCGRRVLYLTWSPELASEASQWFAQAASSGGNGPGVHIRAWDLHTLLGEVLGVDLPRVPRAERIAAFRAFVEGLRLPPTELKSWRGRNEALYDELSVGAISRFLEFHQHSPVFDATAYKRARSDEGVPEAALDAALLVLHRLPLADRRVTSRLFPEPIAALQARHTLTTNGVPPSIRGISGLVVDETQDLSPADLSFLKALAADLDASANLVFAGDEGQTVRPTGFAWATVKRTFSTMDSPAEETVLRSSLRCSRRIAQALERATTLYRRLPKDLRPGDGSWSDASNLPEGTIALVEVAEAETARAHLRQWLNSDQVVLCASLDRPPWLHDFGEEEILTPDLAKGLEYPRVCVVGAGAVLRRILDEDSSERVDRLQRRVLIDGLRVALSRAADHLIVLELAEDLIDDAGVELRRILGADPRSVTHLVELASADDDQEQVVGRLLGLARAILADHPDRAWQAAQRAMELAIEEEHDPVSAAQTVLVIAAGLLTAPELSASLSRERIIDTLNEAAEIAGTPHLAKALRVIDRPFGALPPAERAAWLLDLAALPPHERLPGLLTALRARRQQLADDLSHSPAAWAVLARHGPDVLHEAARWLQIDDRFDEGKRRALCLQAAERALEASDYDATLAILLKVPEPPRELLGCAAASGGRIDEVLDHLVAHDHFEQALELARDHGRIQRAAGLEARVAPPGSPRTCERLADIERGLRDLVEAGLLRPAERTAIALAVDLRAEEVARAVTRKREVTEKLIAANEENIARLRSEIEAQASAMRLREQALKDAKQATDQLQWKLTQAHLQVEQRARALEERAEHLEDREMAVLEWDDVIAARTAAHDATEKGFELRVKEFETQQTMLKSTEETLVARAQKLDERASRLKERERVVLNREQQEDARKEEVRQVQQQLFAKMEEIRGYSQRLSRKEGELMERESQVRSREWAASARGRATTTDTISSATKPAVVEGPLFRPQHASMDTDAPEPPKPALPMPPSTSSAVSPWVLSSNHGIKKAGMLPLMRQAGLTEADWETALKPSKLAILNLLIQAHLAAAKR